MIQNIEPKIFTPIVVNAPQLYVNDPAITQITVIRTNFLNPSFGILADVVHITTPKDPIRFPAKAHGQGFTNSSYTNCNLP